MSDASWHLAALALRLLAKDPAGLGGAVIRMRAGPARQAVLDTYVPPVPVRRIPPSVTDEQLLGGLDLAATLASGHVVEQEGLFESPCTAILPMAERMPAEFAAKIAQLMDQSLTLGILALDEGIDADEAIPDSLSDRLAFHIAPTGRMPAGWDEDQAQDAGSPVCDEEAIAQLALLSTQFGIASLRAPIFALRAARAHAQLAGRSTLTTTDIEIAAALVLAHRATQIPDALQEDETPPAPDHTAPETDAPDKGQHPEELIDTEMLIEAMAALLPAGVLDRLGQKSAKRGASGDGAGRKTRSNRRGRPLPSRPGKLGAGARIDLIGTLRAAAPWQPLRRVHEPDRTGLLIRPSDIRIKRFAQHSDRLLIFSVDASGSAAMARLAEAKGAIELLLAEAYAKRDHVALISFRGEGAQTLLAPTRSLVQTKRQLSALPGGGGTPLAAGLQSAMTLAQHASGQGMTPTIIVLTDGRANVALDGRPGRQAASDDAETMARAIRQQGTDALIIDTANRPQAGLRALSGTLDGAYIALPRADAQKVSAAVDAALRA